MARYMSETDRQQAVRDWQTAREEALSKPGDYLAALEDGRCPGCGRFDSCFLGDCTTRSTAAADSRVVQP